MPTVKVCELEGTALDFAVSKCLLKDGVLTEDPNDFSADLLQGSCVFPVVQKPLTSVGLESGLHPQAHGNGYFLKPSTRWDQGGPIIEKNEIDIYCFQSPKSGCGWWASEITGTKCKSGGNTYLIAGMRCYVASKFGTEVEIPEALS